MPRTRAAGLLIIAFFSAIGTWSIVSDALGQTGDARRSATRSSSNNSSGSAQGLAAWEQVYSVLTHPRCINCPPPQLTHSKETTGTVMSPM